VKNSLYVSGSTSLRSGAASWLRMPSAWRPPSRKKMSELARYIWPIFL